MGLTFLNMSLPSVSYPYNSTVFPFKSTNGLGSVDSHITGCVSSCLRLLIPSPPLLTIINPDNGCLLQAANGHAPSLTSTLRFFPETCPPEHVACLHCKMCDLFMDIPQQNVHFFFSKQSKIKNKQKNRYFPNSLTNHPPLQLCTSLIVYTGFAPSPQA